MPQGTLQQGNIIATPNAGVTPAQTTAALNSGWSPTVVTDANIRESTIPNTIGKANAYTNPNTANLTPNLPGQASAGNNTATTGTGGGADTSNMSYEDLYKNILGTSNAQPIDPVVQQELDLIKNANSGQDAVTQASIAAVQNQYNSRYADTVGQQKASTAGIEQSLNLGGSSRYAPVSSSGILSSKERYDLQTLNDLTATENTQIAGLRQAQADKNYKAMSDQLAILDKTRQDKINLAKDIATNMASTNKDTRDKLMTAQADASKLATQNGAPQSVIEAVKNAKNSADAYAAISGYGGGANIDIQKITNMDGSQSIVRVDKNTGKILGTTNVGGGAPIGSGSTLSPTDYKDFITGLTPEGANNFGKLSTIDQSNVKQLINGDTLLSDIAKSRGAAGSAMAQQLLQKAQSVDPTFSENTNKQRYKFMTEWNDPNTKSGLVRNSINTALGHLADVKKITIDEVKPFDWQFINKVSNWWDAKSGSQGITDLQFGLNQLATEIATVYKGAAPSVEEINAEKSVLGTQMSSGQLNGVLNLASKLLSSKITASRYQYKTTMGKELSSSIIDPEKRQALVDAGIDPKSITKENVPGQAKTGVAAQIDTALNAVNPTTHAKYSPEEVLTHLQTLPEYKDSIQKALGIGWKAQDILDYLSK